MPEPTQRIKGALVLRNLLARRRLLTCVAAAAVVYVLEPHSLALATRALVAWNAGTWLYIVWILTMMKRATERSIRQNAERGDESRFVILTFACLAAAASLAAIFAELAAAKSVAGLAKSVHLGLAGLTILSAWTFIHLIFSQHYAHEYFIERDARRGSAQAASSGSGLHFPGTPQPQFIDFLYFSYVIGVACQTADVETTSAPMRSIALIHGILSFFFNTAILALTINIAAGLV